jgi:aryl-alcohol dehydrogenase-like predicted oxidoreductase
MRYTELGRTGMKISHLSFGASSLGSVFRETNEKESFEAVEAAIEGGINFIDVSPYYGHYKAETVLGKALRNIPRDKYYLSTKVGRYGKDGVNTWDYSAKRVTDSVYESMERLGIDHIDLINVHDIEFQADLPGGLQKVVEETLPALVELREKGVVSHVGITDLQLQNLKWVVEQSSKFKDQSSKPMVESVLNFCHYTLNDDALGDFMGFFEHEGIGVINASPLSMGLLSQRGVPAWHPAPRPLVRACERAAEHCKAKGYPIEKLAVQYAVSNPRIASTLFSSANPENVRRNIEWANEEPDWDLVAEVKEIIGDQQRVTWANS